MRYEHVSGAHDEHVNGVLSRRRLCRRLLRRAGGARRHRTFLAASTPTVATCPLQSRSVLYGRCGADRGAEGIRRSSSQSMKQSAWKCTRSSPDGTAITICADSNGRVTIEPGDCTASAFIGPSLPPDQVVVCRGDLLTAGRGGGARSDRKCRSARAAPRRRRRPARGEDRA